jgi:hypothetical protein
MLDDFIMDLLKISLIILLIAVAVLAYKTKLIELTNDFKSPLLEWIQCFKNPLIKAQISSFINRLLIIAGIPAWLFTIGCYPGPLILIHYGSLIAVFVGAIRVCAEKWGQKRALIYKIGMVLSIYLIILYGKHDQYTERWTDQQGNIFHDTVSRFGFRLIDRDVYFKDGGNASGSFVGEEESKKHGKWIYWSAGLRDREEKFYWYGEEISEGDWYLRNK